MLAVQADGAFHNQHRPDIRFKPRLVPGRILVRFPTAIPSLTPVGERLKVTLTVISKNPASRVPFHFPIVHAP